MITGAHFLLYSKDPDADRKFFREVLGFPAMDAGGGWLIFALPPAELGIHPANENVVQHHADQDLLGAVMYLMCDDLNAVVKRLEARRIQCTEVLAAGWGSATSVRLPSGGQIGLYQPSHPTALDLARAGGHA
jgi:extradiol dioxygenase family protein